MKKLLLALALTLTLAASTDAHAATNVWGDVISGPVMAQPVADPANVAGACNSLRQTITMLQNHMAKFDKETSQYGRAVVSGTMQQIGSQVDTMDRLGCDMSIRHSVN